MTTAGVAPTAQTDGGEAVPRRSLVRHTTAPIMEAPTIAAAETAAAPTTTAAETAAAQTTAVAPTMTTTAAAQTMTTAVALTMTSAAVDVPNQTETTTAAAALTMTTAVAPTMTTTAALTMTTAAAAAPTMTAAAVPRTLVRHGSAPTHARSNSSMGSIRMGGVTDNPPFSVFLCNFFTSRPQKFRCLQVRRQTAFSIAPGLFFLFGSFTQTEPAV
jgi:hypothetical protein